MLNDFAHTWTLQTKEQKTNSKIRPVHTEKGWGGGGAREEGDGDPAKCMRTSEER